MTEKDKEFLKRLLATFRVEAEEHIRSIAAGLLELEKGPDGGRRAELIETVFRDAHSLKGAARSVNYRDIEAICQALEDSFSALKRGELKGSPAIYSLYHQTMDHISGLISPSDHEPGEKDQSRNKELIRQLKDLSQTSGTSRKTENREEVASPPVTGSPAMAETVRIPTNKLDPLLTQAEELNHGKVALSRVDAGLEKISNIIDKWRKDCSGLRGGRSREESSLFKEQNEINDARLKELRNIVTDLILDVKHDYRTLRRIVDEHLEDIKKIIMLPVTSVIEVLPRFVRDAGRDQGKEVDLVMEGTEIEIDKRILEEIKDPLIHLIRNCIDHGIEKPDERISKNKDRRGIIRLIFEAKESRRIEIVVSDDGAGIEIDKVRSATLKSGFMSREETGRLDRHEALGLIFQSGITTSSIITDMSGRGLGLAIVRDKVEKLGGNLSVESKTDSGSEFRLILPMTLATFSGIIVRVEEHLFVLPVIGVEKAARVKRTEIRTVENKETIDFQGRIISVVRLSDALGMQVRPKKAAGHEGNGHISLIILSSANTLIGFQVDEVIGEQQVIVKGLGSQLSRVRNMSGATILNNGKVVPVLNVSDLMKSAVHAGSPVRRTETAAATRAAGGNILVAEDSITARSLIKNILESAGYKVEIAVDGIDAFTQLRGGEFGLIVSDVDMPRMSGFELTTKIRRDKKLGEMPVVLVTALDSREDRERGIEAGANAYIVKSSFDQSNLLEVVKRLI